MFYKYKKWAFLLSESKFVIIIKKQFWLFLFALYNVYNKVGDVYDWCGKIESD